MSFAADYPWAIVYPAHPTNWYDPANHGGVPNKPRAFCLHTPEEPAGDGYPGTPIWFSGANRGGSTHYFVEAIEDPKRPGFCKVYQCVPESFGAIANGKTADKPWPTWADQSTSLNWQTLSVEIEGYGHSIHQTLTPMQLATVAHLVAHRAAAHGFPTDRAHVFGHYEVSNQRTDPGALFPWDKLMTLLALPPEEEDEMMKPHFGQHTRFNGKQAVAVTDQFPINVVRELGVPETAKMVRIEVFKDPPNYIGIAHGEHGYAGCVMKEEKHGWCDVIPDAQGNVLLDARYGPISLWEVRAAGYW